MSAGDYCNEDLMSVAAKVHVFLPRRFTEMGKWPELTGQSASFRIVCASKDIGHC